MYITRIEKGRGRRYRVYADDCLVFALYDNELQNYHIEVNKEIEDNIVETILSSVIWMRAKERAFYLLERRMYTVSMMRDKLTDSDYPEQIVEQVLSFLTEYGYLNDLSYVGMYVRDNCERKSRRQLCIDLQRKGIDKAMLDSFFAGFDYPEELCFARQFEKYIKGKDLTAYSSRQKVFRYFYGKGFSSDIICKYLQHIAEV